MPAKKSVLVVIHGPTAVGKTALSVELAKAFQTSVLSSDSRQFFRAMCIGTAKIKPDEMQGVPHYFVDFLELNDDYSAGKYEVDALAKLSELFEQNDVVVMAGGSGLYSDAVTKGLDDLPKDEKIREELNAQLEKDGIESLQNELREKDPSYFESMDEQNPHRLIRALEVIRSSGKKYSELRLGQEKARSFQIVEIALERPREILYKRINQRVDQMMDKGLLDEVKGLYAHRDKQALNTVGYKELFSYLDKETTLEEAIELIKRNTRRFAKRQLTWLRRYDHMNWIDLEKEADPLEKCIALVKGELAK